MAKTPRERYGTGLAGWLGIFVATAVADPAASRLANRGFSWPDVLLVAAGGFLLVMLDQALRSHAGSKYSCAGR